MTREQFNKAITNTKARFAAIADIESLEDYVIFNAPQNEAAYFSTVYRDGYRDTFPEDLRVFLDNELKKFQK